jgi:hypothetical protein
MKKIIPILVIILFISCGKKIHNQVINNNSYSTVGNNDIRKIKISGVVSDESKLPLPGANISIKGTTLGIQTDVDGNYTILAKNGDVLIFSFIGLEDKEVLVNDIQIINIKLSCSKINKLSPQIITKKPIIYLYPTQKTDVSIKLDFKGKMETTFPKYESNWDLTAYPEGKIFDKKTNRYYNSLFWDGVSNFPKDHFNYKDGFIVLKKDLTSFLIEKLEFIGLSNPETNDFIQFWLPILEKNEINFIHFWINDDYNGICKSQITPKPDSEIRLFMDFYNLENPIEIQTQKLISIDRKGFTYIEWGGTDVTEKMQNLKTP